MAFQGFALFVFSAVGLASLLYYMYTNNAAQEQPYGSDSFIVQPPHVTSWGEEPCNNSQPHTSKNGGSSSKRRRKRSKQSHSHQTPEIDCTICLQKINDEEMRLPCNHQFHVKCIEEWKSQGPIISRYTCPNCRKSYSNM